MLIDLVRYEDDGNHIVVVERSNSNNNNKNAKRSKSMVVAERSNPNNNNNNDNNDNGNGEWMERSNSNGNGKSEAGLDERAMYLVEKKQGFQRAFTMVYGGGDGRLPKGEHIVTVRVGRRGREAVLSCRQRTQETVRVFEMEDAPNAYWWGGGGVRQRQVAKWIDPLPHIKKDVCYCAGLPAQVSREHEKLFSACQIDLDLSELSCEIDGHLSNPFRPAGALEDLLVCVSAAPPGVLLSFKGGVARNEVELWFRCSDPHKVEQNMPSDALIPALSSTLMRLYPQCTGAVMPVMTSLATPAHFNPIKLYNMIRRPPAAPAPLPNVQHASLLPTLRPYQVRAVQWAIQVEEVGYFEDLQCTLFKLLKDMCIRIPNTPFVYNPTLGQMFANVGARQEYSFSVPLADVRGGILADEMGLGKTVETIALVLNRPPDLKAMARENLKIARSIKGAHVDHKLAEVLAKQRVYGGDDDNDDDGDDDDGNVAVPVVGRKRGARAAAAAAPVAKSVKASKSAAPAPPATILKCLCGHMDDARYKGRFVVCPGCETRQHWCCAGFPQDVKEYACSSCLYAAQQKLFVRATCVVAPQSIQEQWVEELRKHAPSLKVLVYAGCKSVQGTMHAVVEQIRKNVAFEERYHNGDLAHKVPVMAAAHLRPYDIIIVNYNVLRAEITHMDISNVQRTRHVRRYPLIPSPILRAKFPRVVLDEAQMVGGGGAVHAAAKMALKVDGVHRWCVSGTPFKRDTKDIQGLLKFLRLDPLSDNRLFAAMLGDPYCAADGMFQERMWDLLRVIMWRTAKRDARLGLQATITRVRVLEFGAAERFNYNRVYAQVVGLSNDHHVQVKHLNIEMHDLRMLCDHFQLGGAGVVGKKKKKKNLRAGSGLGDLAAVDMRDFIDDGDESPVPKKKVPQKEKLLMTQEQLTEHLRDQELHAFHDETRRWLRTRHQLAGILMLQHDYEGAARLYSATLLHSQKVGEGVQQELDDSLLLHAAVNLRDCLGLKRNLQGIPQSAAALDDLIQRCETRALGRYKETHLEKLKLYEAGLKEIPALKLRAQKKQKSSGKAKKEELPWFERAILESLSDTQVADVILSIQSELCPRSHVLTSKMEEARSAQGLVAVITTLLDDLERERTRILELVEKQLRPFSVRDPTAIELDERVRCEICHKSEMDNAMAQGREAALGGGGGAHGDGDVHRPVICSMCLFEKELLRYEGCLYFVDEDICPSCQDRVIVDHAEEDLEHDKAHDILLTDADVEAMTLPQIRKRLKEQNLPLKGTKVELKERLLASQLEHVKTQGKFCGGCSHWWHLRCLPRELRVLAQQQEGGGANNQDFRCGICLGLEVSRKRDLGLMGRRSALSNQILNLVMDYYRGWLKANVGEDALKDDPRFLEMDAQHTRRFKALQEELVRIRSVLSASFDVIGDAVKLNGSKRRFTLVEDGDPRAEKHRVRAGDLDAKQDDEENAYFVVAKQIPRLRESFEERAADLEAARKESLSKYCYLAQGAQQQEDSCPICLESFSADVAILPCLHKLDVGCWNEYHRKRQNGGGVICPLCREKVDVPKIRFVLGNQIQVEVVKEVSTSVVNDKSAAPPRLLPDVWVLAEEKKKRAAQAAGKKAIPVKGSWSVKVEAIVCDLIELFAQPTPCRCLLFSSFSDVLPVLLEACILNGLGSSILFPKSGTAATVAEFKRRAKSEKNVVLFLPLKKGAEGLTLTEANVVMIMEPAYPAALEQQAVARIVRIGQEQQTFVFKYVVSGTVEQRLMEIAQNEEDSKAEEASKDLLSADTIRSILVPPAPGFDPNQHLEQQQQQQDNDRDEDEVWWLETVVRGGRPMSRRDVLEIHLKNDVDEEQMVAYHGVEVPRAAMIEIEKLVPAAQ